jgi:5-methylcytosine-specific restriction endonuclease McrA
MRCPYCGDRRSLPKRGQYAGAAWIGSGRARAHCGRDGGMQADVWRHVDHIVPARLIRRLNAGNPDRRENLQCICGTCHGYKLQADHKLCMGGKLGYLEILGPTILTLGALRGP